MTAYDQEDAERAAQERGWIVYLLHHAKPRVVEFRQLRRTLDRNGFGMSTRRLANHLSYLCELRLIKIESDRGEEMLERQKDQVIQRYADSERDGFHETALARATAAAVNFQQGFGGDFPGVERVR